MKKPFIAFLLLLTSFTVMAGDDCGDCESRRAVNPTVSLKSTNTKGLKLLSHQVESRLAAPEIDHDLKLDICDAMRDPDFELVLMLLEDKGLKLENVFNSIHCGSSFHTLFHFAVNYPRGMKHERIKMLFHFDQVKKNNPDFKYESILNTLHSSFPGTLLDFIERQMSFVSNREGIEELKKFRSEVIERGGKRASEL